MAEYIEREAFIEDIKTEIINLRMSGLKGTPRPHGELYDFIDRINEQPTADVTPVVHGRWEAMHYEGGILDGTNFDKCSVCGYERIVDDEKLKTAFNYCPNCGARMDLED